MPLADHGRFVERLDCSDLTGSFFRKHPNPLSQTVS